MHGGLSSLSVYPRIVTPCVEACHLHIGRNDFGIKFKGDEHATHLKKNLEQWYDVTVDWIGSKYVKIGLKWDYKQRTLETSVPGFVNKALTKYQHPKPAKPRHALAKADPIQYGSKAQQSKPEDTSPQLSPEGIKRIQDIVGTFNDPTIEKTLSSIAGRQAKATEKL